MTPSFEVGKRIARASVLLQEGNIDEAIDGFERVYDEVHNMYYPSLIQDVYSGLAEAYFIKGDLRKAYIYLNRTNKIDHFLKRENTAVAISDLDCQYQNAENSRVLAVAEKDIIVQEKRIAVSKFIIIVLALSMVSLFLAISNLQRKKRLADLFSKQQILQNEQEIEKLEKDRDLIAMRALFSGQEQERRRIARDLHDGLGGMLYALQLQLTSEKQNPETLRIVRQALAENRRISENLLPPTLDRLGLQAALQEWAVFYKATWSIPIDLKFDENVPGLSNDLRISVYRIAQELTNNVARHAKASKVSLHVRLEGRYLVLAVKDNGKGFDTEHASPLLLKTVRSRTQLLNGRFWIESTPGKGTEVTVSVPLQQILPVKTAQASAVKIA